MRKHQLARARWLLLATFSAFAVLVPSASAETAPPVWTCRASATYVELDPLLGPQRVEPIVANGFADRDAPDAPQCTRQDQGVPNVTLTPDPARPPLLTLQAPFARTSITPALAPAREQTVTATGGVVDPLRIQLGDLVITARAVRAEARGTCVGTTPTLTASSTVVELTVGGQAIDIPAGPGQTTIDLAPVAIVTLNERVVQGDATTADQALTQRAVHIQVLPRPGVQPAADIVLGEAKVDRHGAVCAPPPPPPACPAGSVAQSPGGNPLVCVLTVTAPCPAGSTADPGNGGACLIVQQAAAPCPAGSTADPAAGGACVVVRQAPPANCPTGTVRDPATNNCVLVRDRPCPEGATADPATGACVVRVLQNTGSGVNGRVGDAAGPAARCGRLEMHFVRGGRRTLTNRFGTRVVTRGRLVTCGANPRAIVGARVDVVHVLPDGRRLRKTGMRSRSQGRLTLILPLDLRSRRIEYAYRPDLRSTRATSRVTLRLTVRNRRGRILR